MTGSMPRCSMSGTCLLAVLAHGCATAPAPLQPRALALQALHETYLNYDDAVTARDECSDGFITCVSAMAQAE